MGEFVFDEKDEGRCWLYVGTHQRLRGEVKKLPVPLGVLGKRRKEGAEEKRRDGDGDGEWLEGEELEIREVIRWKVLFGSRPEPVTGGER